MMKERLKMFLIKIRQTFCRHKWEVDYRQPVFALAMSGGGLKICKKCGKTWMNPRFQGISIRWWDRMFIRLGLLQFIDPIIREDLKDDPGMRDFILNGAKDYKIEQKKKEKKLFKA